jgi:dynein heavy chain
LDSEEASIVTTKYNEIYNALDAYEKQVFNMWSLTISDESEANLQKPLLVRKDGLIGVNFDPKVVALLREVKYFGSLGVQPPDVAVEIYAKAETFRGFIFALETISNTYNSIITGVLDVERPLFEKKIEAIDGEIAIGIEKLNWKSDSISSYIDSLSKSVGSLSSTLQTMKNNLNQITSKLRNWAATPLIERKDGKKLLNLEEKESKLNVAFENVKKDGVQILELVDMTRNSLEADESSTSWLNYRKYIDTIVRDGFFKVIHDSLNYIYQNMDKEKICEFGPLLEAKLELGHDNLVFTPSMDEDAPGSLKIITEDIIEDIFMASSMMARVLPALEFTKQRQNKSDQAVELSADVKSTDPIIDAMKKNEVETYLAEMRQNEVLDNLRTGIIKRVGVIIDLCAQYKEGFDQYTYLWTENRQEYMKKFLELPKTGDESSPEHTQQTRQPIPLDKFEVEIKKFEGIHRTIMSMEPEVVFNGWFRVDIKPLKQALNVHVKKWSFTLTKYLFDDTQATLEELNEFTVENRKGLSVKIDEGDYDGLIKAMGLLHAIKIRMTATDNIFEPIRKTVNLLRQFGVEFDEHVHKLLNDLPEQWSDVKKLSVSIKDQVAPLQAKEVDVLQQKCNKFEMKNHNFREEFRKKAPFRFDLGPEKAYEIIDTCHFDVVEMETSAASLRNSCELFELAVPTYRQLQDCRRDIGMLKTMWDLVGLVTYMFDQWKTTLWDEIDTDQMESRCRELSKDMRKLDKEIKGWEVFTGLDQTVKDMVTSLRAVGELRSNAIRERHWKQLMKTTGVTFVLTKDMKFQDLLSLQLHKFEDDVKVIVDRATKELAMEKVLNDLDKTWGALEFTYETFPDDRTPLLRSSEELIETLEDNQVMLQTMMTSKYVSHFEEQITKWQIALSAVDSVVTLWLEVQQTWSHLVNIFIGSEDIRVQLPEDSKRFDGIDADYKVLMIDAQKYKNCVKCCNRDGVYDNLEGLQGKLALCEKSLAEYLETKRLAFPRFYFVSGSDLLDILAKGNLPMEVAQHLPKLFDNIAKLEFSKDSNGQYTKNAVGMYSLQDEYVEFFEPCDCRGAVENWLNRLISSMRDTLRHKLGESVASYEEKPREQWIFDFPAQIVLAGSQIWWTTEVNAAFSRLEEGYENSLKDYYKKQVNQLTALIGLIQGELTKGDRQMIMSLCTLDVHARDMVAKLILEKAENSQCFTWQSQLRLRWDDATENDCFINICDAVFRYNYEYLGNTPRLVITALTDRCYITLTQSLHLIMGGAPAGPAGTGKTETVKDLGKALAIMVYVFNCSEQMDYKSIGNIFKGLAQSGTWGCFDEFNRIAVEVLSVVATQVKSIQDALRAKKKRFIFQGEEIGIVRTVGEWITMNPGIHLH